MKSRNLPRVSEEAARVSWPPLCHQKQPVRRPTMTYCRMSCLLMLWKRLTLTALHEWKKDDEAGDRRECKRLREIGDTNIQIEIR